MSEENVEIVRRCLEASRGDIGALRATFDPAATLDMSAQGLPATIGFEGLAQTIEAFTGTFEQWDTAIDEILPGRDCVFAKHTQTGRGKGSGAEVKQSFHSVVTLRNGRIIHWQTFSSRQKALEAAGLSE